LVDRNDILLPSSVPTLKFQFYLNEMEAENGGLERTAFKSIARLALLIFVKSVPIKSGLFAIAQVPKCALSSAIVNPQFPTSNISKSLKPPGPAQDP
jgi:hypothetical protein